jgi:hypothetical protein
MLHTERADLPFNQDKTLLPGLVVGCEGVWSDVLEVLLSEQAM